MRGAAIEFFPPRYLRDRPHAARDQILRPPAGAADRFEQRQIDPDGCGVALKHHAHLDPAPLHLHGNELGENDVARRRGFLFFGRRDRHLERNPDAVAAEIGPLNQVGERRCGFALDAQPLTPRLSGLQDRRQPMCADAGLLERLRDGIAVGEDLSGGG